jgi:imidazolonepropionase-like amidohydrolase
VRRDRTVGPERHLHAGLRRSSERVELGTLEPGKRADVVVVDGDPYDFATLKDRIEQVWKDGVRVV